MELLTTALVIALLSTTASAKPMDWRLHRDADIADNDQMQGWLAVNRGSLWSAESSSYKDSSSESSESLESEESSESSESQSSESQSSEESSEEVPITNHTTMVVTPTAVTTISNIKRSTPTRDPDTGSTDGPTASGKTIPPATPSTSNDTTTSGCVKCFTVEIPTAVPITEKRGDN